MGEHGAVVRSCIHRWIATRARCPASARNLRSHSQEHHGPEDHDSLHGYRSNDEASGILSRIPGILDAAAGDQEDMVQPIHSTDWRSDARNPSSRGADAGHQRYDAIAKAISETGYAAGSD